MESVPRPLTWGDGGITETLRTPGRQAFTTIGARNMLLPATNCPPMGRMV
jgi:hypothetical protein